MFLAFILLIIFSAYSRAHDTPAKAKAKQPAATTTTSKPATTATAKTDVTGAPPMHHNHPYHHYHGIGITGTTITELINGIIITGVITIIIMGDLFIMHHMHGHTMQSKA